MRFLGFSITLRSWWSLFKLVQVADVSSEGRNFIIYGVVPIYRDHTSMAVVFAGVKLNDYANRPVSSPSVGFTHKYFFPTCGSLPSLSHF